MATARELLATADAIGASFHKLLEGANVNDSGEARISACLCLTIGELYIAVIAVFRSSAQRHGPVLIRSMHEAPADLKNLVADASYLEQMSFENARQTLSVVKELEADPDLEKDEDAMKAMAGWRSIEQPIYDKLKGKNLKPLTVVDAFRRAGMAGEYGSYRFMCSFAHSNLTTLIARHAGARSLRFADALPLETLKSTLGMAVSIYTRAIETVPHYTDIPVTRVVTAIDAANEKWGPI